MSVSRVVYDAALTRVKTKCYGNQECPQAICYCVGATLAALGLDEPPTEAKCRAPHCWSEYGTPCGTCPVVPPTEPPTACPTCEEPRADAAFEADCIAFDEHDDGSGIDRGTHDG